MNVAVIVLSAVVFCILFTVLVFSTTGKNGKTGKDVTAQVHNYPPEIQEEYFKTHERIPVEPLSGRVIALKSIGILIFTAILLGLAILSGAKTFLQGFLFAFGMMLFIGAYDTFFLDWVLFANMKRFRLEGTEHMDKEYHQKWFHVKGMLFPGVIFAIVPAALVGLLVMLIK